MIFAYYDRNGILRETITVPVRVGDDDYDKVYLFFAGKNYDADLGAYPADIAEGSVITSTFRNSADGVESPETFSETEILSIPFDPERDLKFFKYYTNYQFYVANVPTSVLATAGSVSCTPRQIYADAHARAYGTLLFPVEGGVVIADHAVMTSEYDYLLSLTNNVVSNENQRVINEQNRNAAEQTRQENLKADIENYPYAITQAEFNLLNNQGVFGVHFASGEKVVTVYASQAAAEAAGETYVFPMNPDIDYPASDVVGDSPYLNIPAPPSVDGDYALKCSVADGVITYEWEVE